MGLGPIAGIYQARFNRYLHNRGLKDTSNQRVWCFLGDGECDEPESLGALSVGQREGLDNLIFVINCNLQRLDGPVRGNGKIIQELEATFRGAGWNVIKVIWGPEWDPLLAADTEGALVKRMNETVDGQFQKYSVESGAYIRKDFFGADERVLKIVEHLSDDDLTKLRRGGHSYRKLYAAYKAAVEHKGQPVVILAKTVKGWTLGEGFEASNVTHQMKKLDEQHLRKFRDTLHLPIPDEALGEAPYYHPGKDSDILHYMLERRNALGGHVPTRKTYTQAQPMPQDTVFSEFFEGSKSGVEVSTTMAFVRMLRNKTMGKHVVPIIPDEARTFGMDAFFREFGIYASQGQKYEPVDAKLLLNYHESKNGQLLEEGITEAGSMASFQAASTALSTHGVPTIPFYLYYSMFGLQRTGDQVWQIGDARGRGFMLGCTAGRTTLNGEGLQHEDGHSQFFAFAYPKMMAYDPAFAYETAVIVRDGLDRMLQKNQDLIYYITLYNENYMMPSMPEGAEEGIIKGMYLLRAGSSGKIPAQIFGSGPLILSALEAQKILAEQFDVAANVWSITSYQQLYREARRIERDNFLHPDKPEASPYIAKVLKDHAGPVIVTSDWIQEIPHMLSRFVPNRFFALGTDGLGRSDTREALRRHFEIDAGYVVVATLYNLLLDGKIEREVVAQAMLQFAIDPEKLDPMRV
jgi:pyruvate dehydrogenase E1 component